MQKFLNKTKPSKIQLYLPGKFKDFTNLLTHLLKGLTKAIRL